MCVGTTWYSYCEVTGQTSWRSHHSGLFTSNRKEAFITICAGRGLHYASFHIPQAILEDLYCSLLIKQCIYVMLVVYFTPINLTKILKMILNALWFCCSPRSSHIYSHHLSLPPHIVQTTLWHNTKMVIFWQRRFYLIYLMLPFGFSGGKHFCMCAYLLFLILLLLLKGNN